MVHYTHTVLERGREGEREVVTHKTEEYTGKRLTQTRGERGQSLSASVVKSRLVAMPTTSMRESVKKASNPEPELE